MGQTWLPLHIRMGKEGSNYKNSLYLFSALQKYGADKFQYEILVQCRDQESADYLEEHFISQYDSRNPQIGYNLKEGGSAGRHSDETKKKISDSLKAKVWSPQALLGRSMAGKQWAGRKRGPMTAEHKLMVIKTLKPGSFIGHHHSENALTKMSEATKKAWCSGAHTPESIRQSAETRKMDSEREQNIVRDYQQGATIESIEKKFGTSRGSIYRILKRNNISRERDHKNWTGKEHSEETKQKMAEARKRYWDAKKADKSGTSDPER